MRGEAVGSRMLELSVSVPVAYLRPVMLLWVGVMELSVMVPVVYVRSLMLLWVGTMMTVPIV